MSKWAIFNPIIVMHPLEKTDGGLTDFERRGLMELAESIGGREVFIWVGRELLKHELKTLSFVEAPKIIMRQGQI